MRDQVNWRSDSNVSTAYIRNLDVLGLTLGDLRKLIALADGMPDDAQVLLERLEASGTYVRQWHAKEITVRSQARVTKATP